MGSGVCVCGGGEGDEGGGQEVKLFSMAHVRCVRLYLSLFF